jgi:hypothetical protein
LTTSSEPRQYAPSDDRPGDGLLGLGLIISVAITTAIALALTALVPWKDEDGAEDDL